MNEKGAASVFIILMMVFLVTLGAFVITSANINLKFCMRASDWQSLYYRLDGEGEVFLAELDGKLAEAARLAINYVNSSKINGMEPMDGNNGGSIGSLVFDSEYVGMRLRNDELKKAFAYVYLYYADISIAGLSQDYPGCVFYAWGFDEPIEEIIVSLDIPDTGGKEGTGLNVGLFIKPVPVTVSGGTVSLVGNGGARYAIDSWCEYQAPIDDERDLNIKFWDGVLE